MNHNYLDRIILCLMFTSLLGTAIFFQLRTPADMDAVHWAREQTGTVIGALLTLVTGYAITRGLKNNEPKE